MTKRPTSSVVLEMRNVTKRLGSGANQVMALDGVDLAVHRGTFVAVVGPSGSGKSTLLHCAAGLDQPTSGSVTVEGRELSGLDETELTRIRRTRLGFIFQSYNLIPTLSVVDNIVLPLQFAHKRHDKAEARTLLEQLGIGDRAQALPSELSGGEQQRAAIARALLSHPALIVADEPTGALDTRSAHDVLTILRTAVRAHGQTILMVTHDPVAAATADSVVFFADGRVDNVLQAPTTESVTAGMMRLAATSPRSTVDVRQ